MSNPRFTLSSTDPADVVRHFKQWEPQMRALRRAIIALDGTEIEDLNRDRMRFEGVSFGSAALRELFAAIGMVVDPKQLEAPPAGMTSREYRITARYPWGHDRIL